LLFKEIGLWNLKESYLQNPQLLKQAKSPREFETIVKMVKGMGRPSSVTAETAKDVRMPLVSIGPSGIGGEYQWEWFG
jgi:hypothetical protein